MVKNPPANAKHIREASSVPGSGRCPGGVYGNLLQYSRLENPMDRGGWRVTVHGVTKRPTTTAELKLLLLSPLYNRAD